ncbi:MAG: RHS repeat protein, partial [Planctomycetes bacterium]|nr:RHS repeat protein [Planctomycetota bacterium]
SGETIDVTYDAGRVKTRVTSGGESETFDWNAVGDPLGFSDPTGTGTWSYDPGGRPVALSHSDGSSVAWSWDVLGRLAAVTVTSGSGATPRTTSYRYNAAGDLVEVEIPEFGVSSFEYDAVHRLSRRTLPTGVVSEWTYDLRDRVSSVRHLGPDGGVLAAYVYTRGPLGQIDRVDREDGSAVEWDYDAALRVTAERRYDPAGALESETAWGWDGAGNRISETRSGVVAAASYLPGQRLQEVSVGGVATESYAWDADGRLASMSREGTTWTLGYDSKDALRSVSDGATTIDYVHDAIGRRRSASDGTRTRSFVVAPVVPGGLGVVHNVSDGSGGSQVGWAGTEPLARVDAGGTVRWYLGDGLG